MSVVRSTVSARRPRSKILADLHAIFPELPDGAVDGLQQNDHSCFFTVVFNLVAAMANLDAETLNREVLKYTDGFADSNQALYSTAVFKIIVMQLASRFLACSDVETDLFDLLLPTDPVSIVKKLVNLYHTRREIVQLESQSAAERESHFAKLRVLKSDMDGLTRQVENGELMRAYLRQFDDKVRSSEIARVVESLRARADHIHRQLIASNEECERMDKQSAELKERISTGKSRLARMKDIIRNANPDRLEMEINKMGRENGEIELIHRRELTEFEKDERETERQSTLIDLIRLKCKGDERFQQETERLRAMDQEIVKNRECIAALSREIDEVDAAEKLTAMEVQHYEQDLAKRVGLDVKATQAEQLQRESSQIEQEFEAESAQRLELTNCSSDLRAKRMEEEERIRKMYKQFTDNSKILRDLVARQKR